MINGISSTKKKKKDADKSQRSSRVKKAPINTEAFINEVEQVDDLTTSDDSTDNKKSKKERRTFGVAAQKKEKKRTVKKQEKKLTKVQAKEKSEPVQGSASGEQEGYCRPQLTASDNKASEMAVWRAECPVSQSILAPLFHTQELNGSYAALEEDNRLVMELFAAHGSANMGNLYPCIFRCISGADEVTEDVEATVVDAPAAKTAGASVSVEAGNKYDNNDSSLSDFEII